MFKPTPHLHGSVRRLPLSAKLAGKEFYKGTGVGTLGTIDRSGNFKPDWSKIRTFVYPQNAKNSYLTPFVAAATEKTRLVEAGNYYENYPKRFTGEDYLRNWKISGGHDIVIEDETETMRAKKNENMPIVADVRPVKGGSIWK